MLQFLYNFLINCASLIRSPLPAEKKRAIFLAYLRISLKDRVFKYDKMSENFLGFKIEGVPHSVILFLFSEIFVRNEYFFYTQESRPIIFDCGANCGFATIYFKWLYPQAEIIAFEPDPVTFSVLQHTIELNALKDVTAQQIALSDHDGEVEFFTDAVGGSLKMSLTRRSEANRIVKVPSKCLSSFLSSYPKISYIKMDIEGAERGVISEVMRTGLKKNIDQMGIEYHHHLSDSRTPELGTFLQQLESSGFDYVVAARHAPGTNIKITQDVFLTLERALITK